MSVAEQNILDAMADAEEKAWKSLAGYKFWMFGYHAGRWVNCNALLPRVKRRPNPFRESVQLARMKLDGGKTWLPEEGVQQASLLNTLEESV